MKLEENKLECYFEASFFKQVKFFIVRTYSVRVEHLTLPVVSFMLANTLAYSA